METLQQKTSASQRRLSPGRKWTYSLFVTFCAVMALETVARCWLYYLAPKEYCSRYAVASEFPQALKYVPHHYCCYRLSANYQRGETHHNSLGYRGSEINAAKPANCFRILVLGGSTTYGEFIDDDRDTFPAQLQDHLRRAGFSTVEVINAGVPGYNSWESLADLEFVGSTLQPDLVIPYYGVNDVHCRLVKPESYRADNSGRRRLWNEPLPISWCKHSVLIRMIGYHVGVWRDPGIDAYVQADSCDPGTHGDSRIIGNDPMSILDNNSPTYFSRNLKMTAAISESVGAKVMFASWAYCSGIGDYASTPHYRRGISELNEAIRHVAAERNALFYDFTAQMPMAHEFWRDGRHVNARGAKAQAELFAEFIIANANDLGLSKSTNPDRKETQPQATSLQTN